MEQIIDEACFAKNAMLLIGKATPYKAVVGQAPNLLQDSEAPNTSMMEDAQHLHRARVRELALGTIVEQTARMRIERTLKAKSRVPGQDKDYKRTATSLTSSGLRRTRTWMAGEGLLRSSTPHRRRYPTASCT